MWQVRWVTLKFFDFSQQQQLMCELMHYYGKTSILKQFEINTLTVNYSDRSSYGLPTGAHYSLPNTCGMRNVSV